MIGQAKGYLCNHLLYYKQLAVLDPVTCVTGYAQLLCSLIRRESGWFDISEIAGGRFGWAHRFLQFVQIDDGNFNDNVCLRRTATVNTKHEGMGSHQYYASNMPRDTFANILNTIYTPPSPRSCMPSLGRIWANNWAWPDYLDKDIPFNILHHWCTACPLQFWQQLVQCPVWTIHASLCVAIYRSCCRLGRQELVQGLLLCLAQHFIKLIAQQSFGFGFVATEWQTKDMAGYCLLHSYLLLARFVCYWAEQKALTDW